MNKFAESDEIEDVCVPLGGCYEALEVALICVSS